MRFIDNRKIKASALDLNLLAGSEIVGHDDDLLLCKGVQASALVVVVVAGVNDFVVDAEFFCKFESPLLADGGRADNDNLSLSNCPILAKHQAGLDGLAEANLICENHAFGKR